MLGLERDTKWRQGSILKQEDAKKLGLVLPNNLNTRAIVISHDCDLPNDKDPGVEVIIGLVVSKIDPNYVRAHNVRCLHIKYDSTKDIEKHFFIELRHPERRMIEKDRFSQAKAPDLTLWLPEDEKQALKQWLAAHYWRPAFPDAFENRLRKKSNKDTVEKKMAKILTKANQYLVAVFFDLGESRYSELPENDPYYLRIMLVYDHKQVELLEQEKNAKMIAEDAATKIAELFYSVFGKPSVATELVLEECFAIADNQLSFADVQSMDQWRVEYISLRESTPDNLLLAGRSP